MNELQNKINEAIGNVKDPDIGKTLAELEAVESIEIKDKLIDIKLRLIQPIHLVAERVNNLCVESLRLIAPEYECEIEFSEKEFNTEREFLSGVKNIIAVASGKGGVGKSAVSANLAAALAQSGARVGLLDGDVYGPSQPTMYGLNEAKLEAIKDDEGNTIAYPIEKHGIKVASMGFVLNRDEAAIIRGPMLAGYFSMLFEQVQWGSLDYLIFDLPPGTGDIQLTLTQKIPLTGAVIVTTPQEIALADVRRAIAMFNRVNVKNLGIIENMSYFIPPDMPDKKYYIFGKGGGKDIAKEKNIPLLGEIPLDIEMRNGNDSGMPVVLADDSRQKAILIHTAENLAAEIRRANAEQKEDSLDIDV